MENLNLAIDLGTTNSVLAYGNLGKNGVLKTIAVEIERRNEDGAIERKKTLPSAVFYNKNKEDFIPIVGDFAKATYGKKYGYVSKSVKSLMGIKENAGLNDEIPDKTPEEVSAQILNHLLVKGKKFLFAKEDLKDVIITIPASFEPAQRQATIEAARIAGIDTENSHDILLYEPKAVIYNLVNLIENNEIPSGVIDISEPKSILVFDLGGGTLDVTIHKVGYKNEIPYVEDIAISRYTQIGGDDFDELIARDLYRRFEEQCEITIPQNRKEEVMCKVRKIAERLKIEVSQYYDNANIMGTELDDSYEFSVDVISLFDDYSFSEYITLREFKNMFASLMGEHLTIDDVNTIDKLCKKDINNIIYPILDTLAKAKAKQNNIQIDAIILNGGMTKFYPIKERIDKFLNIESICITNPDLAVAEGAAYYHYCLHKYNIGKSSDDVVSENKVDEVFNTKTILNDTLSLGVKGEYIYELVSAGTSLPYSSNNILNKFILSEETDQFVIEVFSGRGKNKNLPNVKIASKIVKLDFKYPKGTEVTLNVKIDNMKFIDIDVIVENSPERKYTIKVDGKNDIEEKLKKISRLGIMGKTSLNVLSEINNLKYLSQKIERPVQPKIFLKVKSQIEKLLDHISKASNHEEFYEIVIKELKNSSLNDFFRGYLYKISNDFFEAWEEEQKRNVLIECEKHFKGELKDLTDKEYVLDQAIQFIARYDENLADEYRRQLIIKTKNIKIS